MSNHVREVTNQADELAADELEHVSGGDVTFEYGALQVKYTQQKPDGRFP